MLLPPSEGKASGGKSHGWTPDSGAFKALAAQRGEISETLRSLEGGDAKLLGVSGDHLARAKSANRALVGAATLPAWQRYTGVVWDHLDPTSLPAAERRRIIIVSGLLGLARADDPVPDYRLKIGANPPGLAKLSTWWRDDVSDTLNSFARRSTGGKRRVIVDLLPKEHRAAWRPDERVQGVSVEFVDPSGKPGGHFAKAAKGELARSILTEGIGALDRWRHERFELGITPLG